MMRFYETLPTEHRWQVSKRINEICPAHWERIRLNEIARVQNGFAFKSKFFSKNGDGFPLIRIRDVGAPDTETNYSGEFEPEYIVRHGDIIIGMDGEFRCRKWLGCDALLNQRVCRLVPTSNDVHIEFFFKILQPYLDAVEQVTSSVTVKHLSSHTVEDLELPLPPLAEQQRIVAKIEALQERSRRAREALTEVEPLLEQFRRSVLAAAFRGDLTADWRAAHPNVEPASELLHRIRTERRRRWEQAELAKYKAKGQNPPKNWKEKYKEPEPIDDSDLPELPAGWCWATLGELALIDSGGAFKKRDYSASGPRLFQIANVGFGKTLWQQRNFLPERFTKSHGFLLLDNMDIVIAFNRPILDGRLKVTRITNDDLPAILYQRVGRLRIAIPRIVGSLVSGKKW